VWVKDYLRKRETFECYNSVRFSESQSDLVNYMRIDIEMFEDLFSLVETQFFNKIVSMHDIMYYYLLFQISN